MPRTRTWLIALLLAGFALRGCAADLLQIWAQARQADPVLAAADNTRRVQAEAVVQARAPLLPQLSATLVQANARDAGSVSHAGSAQAHLSQVLFDLSQRHQLGAAQATARAQDELVRAAEQALMVRVASAYFGVLDAQAQLATVQANEAAFAQQVTQADERWRLGLAARVDVEQARAFHATARGATIAAAKALAEARDALAEIIGNPPPGLAALADELPMRAPEPADVGAWIERALADNPALRAQRDGVAAASRGVDAARAARLPTLATTLDLGHGGSTAFGADARGVAALGVTLSLPLYSGDLLQSRVRQAQLLREGSDLALEQQRRRVVRDVSEQFRAVALGVEQTEAARDAATAAQRALDSTRAGHGLGTQTMNELLQAIQTLAAARSALSSARHRFVLSTLLLRQAAGTLAETDLAQLNAWLR